MKRHKIWLASLSAILVISLAVSGILLWAQPSNVAQAQDDEDGDTNYSDIDDSWNLRDAMMALINESKQVNELDEKSSLLTGEATMAESGSPCDCHSLDAADGDPEDAVYVDEYGRVGINTTDPNGNRLYVNGSTYIDYSLDVNGAISHEWEYNGDSTGILMGTTFGPIPLIALQAQLAGSPQYVWGMGLIPFDDDSAGLKANSLLIGNMGVSAVQESGIMITAEGNVGVGTPTPSTKLQVTGTITATGGDSDNWNEAYIWGNHADAGYLTGYTETDPTVLASVKDGVSWGEVSSKPAGFADGIDNDTNLSESEVDNYVANNGYLTEESDPVFGASAASGISTSNINNWNTAYGWGNHASQGYLTTESDPKVGSLSHQYVPFWNDYFSKLQDGSIWDNGISTGIGTDNPVARLHIKNPSGNILALDDDTTRVFTVTEEGNVGIGRSVSSPSEKLYVSTSTGEDVDPLRVRTEGSTQLLVSKDKGVSIGVYETSPPPYGLYVYGDVGIGTTTPSEKLTVCGNILIRDSADNADLVELGEGLDYSEGFDVSDSTEIEPGTVLSIDPDNPGELMVSHEAYDSKVVGIVSGANGLGSAVKVGGDKFDTNVALAGRVYCNVDATEEGIEPGDMLTTSANPGYAMKVTSFDEANGAVIGKAMESLEKGSKGQIMVLVTLQ